MASTILPVTQLDTQGLVVDRPPVSAPPQALSVVRNVRFKDGAIRKSEGEEFITATGIPGNMVYLVYWKTVKNLAGYYMVVTEDAGESKLYAVPATGGASRYLGKVSGVGYDWDHTIFQGGYTFILNSQQHTPWYVTEEGYTINNLTIYVLPAFGEYNLDVPLVDYIYNNSNTQNFDIGIVLDFNYYSLNIHVQRPSTNGLYSTYILVNADDASEPSLATYGITINPPSGDTNSTKVTFGGSYPLQAGDKVVMTATSKSTVTNLKVGVIQSYGDLLVAGNTLEELGGTEVRAMPNSLRISDVAKAGTVPNNWNPFAAGVSTADEITLTTSGEIKELIELQGQLLVYTENSITALVSTGNPSIPFTVNNITNSYGIDRKGSVIEFDGKHFVVGNEDIYIFSGHPSSIESIADDRVRKSFFQQYDRSKPLSLVRHAFRDEIWVCFYTIYGTPLAFIWDYRKNVWSLRDIPPFNKVVMGFTRTPVAITNDELVALDVDNKFTNRYGQGYVSFIERRDLAINYEYKVESTKAMVMWAEASSPVTFNVNSFNTDILSNRGVNVNFAAENDFQFKVGSADADYKVDLRNTGRFLQLRIDDGGAASDWSISGIQIEIKEAGSR